MTCSTHWKGNVRKHIERNLPRGVPAPETLKKYLKAVVLQNKLEESHDRPTLYKLINRFSSGEIKHKGKKKKQGTLDNYKYFKQHLEAFEKDKKYKVDSETISLDFFYKFTSCMEDDLKLSPNTIAKNIRLLKAVMAEAVDLEETNNPIFMHKKFTYAEEETEAVYLSEQEIMQMYNADLGGSKRLEQVRDLFVFGCFVGLRFSDYSNVQPHHTVEVDGETYIKMPTKKTEERVIIPCPALVLELFNKYGTNANKLPAAPSNQKFNDYVKEVAQIVKLDESGRLTGEPEKLLYDCISSHTARRSFATNLYLDGFPIPDIMKITGHKTEKAFIKYIKISKIDTARSLHKHYKLKAIEKAKSMYVA